MYLYHPSIHQKLIDRKKKERKTKFEKKVLKMDANIIIVVIIVIILYEWYVVCYIQLQQ